MTGMGAYTSRSSILRLDAFEALYRQADISQESSSLETSDIAFSSVFREH